jgi:predicted transcriptional regulator
VHHAALTPGTIRVQVAQLPDGATFLTVARCLTAPAAHWNEPPPVHVIGMGCDISHAPDLVYADGLDLEAAVVGIGLSCRLCNRLDCRSRAFPPLEHRLEMDPAVTGTTPWRFAAAAGGRR